MKKNVFYAMAIAMMAFGATACGSSEEKKAENTQSNESAQVEATSAQEAAAGVVNVTNDDQFRPDKKVERFTVLDFNATWCVPCKKLTPAFHMAADSLANIVEFYTVDIDNNPKTKEAFNVQGVPTVVLMSPDGNVTTLVGLDAFISPEQIQNAGAETTQIIYNNLIDLIKAQSK